MVKPRKTVKIKLISKEQPIPSDMKKVWDGIIHQFNVDYNIVIDRKELDLVETKKWIPVRFEGSERKTIQKSITPKNQSLVLFCQYENIGTTDEIIANAMGKKLPKNCSIYNKL